MRNLAWLTILWLLPFSSASSGQEPIRVDVHLINVAFSVMDSEGKFVSDLNQDDFDVLEDNVPQKISFFAPASETPLKLGLVMDFSGSQSQALNSHHKDLETFLKTVITPRDRAFLLCFENHLRLVDDFTSQAKDIVDSLDHFEAAVRRVPKEKKGIRVTRANYPEMGPPEVRPLFTGTAFFDAIYESIAEKFRAEQQGRKALVIFSDGEDNSSARDELETIEIAQANDAVLFCVRYTELKHGVVTSRNKYGKTVMARIARDTGGADFDAHEKGLAANFNAIGDQLRSSYELAYHTTNPVSDGSFHKILIRCRRPGMAIRAKSGYIAN